MTAYPEIVFRNGKLYRAEQQFEWPTTRRDA
jgi:hypothetical protein